MPKENCIDPDSCFSAEERALMLQVARNALRSAVIDGTVPEMPERDLMPNLLEKRSCFVTLTKYGALRGCIGNLQPQEPLLKAIMNNARNAATRDPRFAPVSPEEVGEIRIEISVLTEPRAVAFSSPEELLEKLQPNLDGVVMRIGGALATFLPQVWQQLSSKEEFLNHLSKKAGCDPAAWRHEPALVSTYRVEVIEEPCEPLQSGAI